MPDSALKTREDTSPPPDSDPGDADADRSSGASLLHLVRDWLRFGRPGRNGDASIRETLGEMLEAPEEGASALTQEERALLKNLLAFGETTVRDIMVPRADIAAVEADVTIEELERHITRQHHTRIPVYEGSLDTVKGFIHVKDLLPMLGGRKPYSLAAALRNTLFVPPSMRLLDLLRKMRLSGAHMAMVVDEYGGTDGLVTLEDVFEEIVGDIQDEHDEEERLKRPFAWSADGTCEMDARAQVENVERDLKLRLRPHHRDEEFDTIGGLIFIHAKRVPAKRETIAHPSGIRFEILQADPRRIRRVILKKGGARKRRESLRPKAADASRP